MKQYLQERIARVVERSASSLVTEKVLGGTDTDELEQARKREQEARAKALARAAANNNSSGGSTAEATSPDAIEQIQQDEDCPICAKILTAVKEMDDPRRTKGVAEYGKFKTAIEDSEEAAEAVLEDSEVLVDALNSIDGVAGV